MFRNLAIFFCFLFLTSCKCQKSVSTDENKDISSEKIMVFLREKNFEIVSSANLIVVYDIKKTLIEGTTDEYSNKVVLKDTLEHQKAEQLLELLKDDSSYDWNQTSDETLFEPTKQILLKGKGGRLSLMFDNKRNILGFINLDGQRLIFPSKNLTLIINNLTRKK